MIADPRACTAIPIDPGPAGLDTLVPALAAALAGTGPAIALLPTSGSPEYLARIGRALQAGAPVPGEVAVVAATSGSTGDPAGVLLPASALVAATHALGERVDAPDGHRWVAALPLHHAGGLMVAVRSAVGGTDPLPLDSLGGARPFTVDSLATTTSLARRRSDADGLPLAISLVPTMLAEVDSAGARGWDVLCEYDLVLVGGAAAPRALVDRLLFAGVALSTSYGMTETCGGSVVDGRALPGVEVSADPAGRLVISGDQVALAYRDGRRPERWGLGADRRRSFRTDDLGEVGPDGVVRVTGRADDVVQVGGASVALGAVRTALLGDPRILEAEVVGLPDQRWGTRIVAVVVDRDRSAGAVPGGSDGGLRAGRLAGGGGPEPAIDSGLERAADRDLDPSADRDAELAVQLRARVIDQLGRSAAPRAVLVVASMPMSESGKPDRQALTRIAAERSRR